MITIGPRRVSGGAEGREMVTIGSERVSCGARDGYHWAREGEWWG